MQDFSTEPGKLWTNLDKLVSLIKTIQRGQIKVLVLRFEASSLWILILHVN